MRDLKIGVHLGITDAPTMLSRIRQADGAGLDMAWNRVGGIALDPIVVFSQAGQEQDVLHEVSRLTRVGGVCPTTGKARARSTGRLGSLRGERYARAGILAGRAETGVLWALGYLRRGAPARVRRRERTPVAGAGPAGRTTAHAGGTRVQRQDPERASQ